MRSHWVDSALYSLTSSAARPATGMPTEDSLNGVVSTQRAAPGPVVPTPMRTRRTARTSAAGSPSASRPTCSTVASVPTAAYEPSTRGTSRTCGLPVPVAAERAASTAARTSVSFRSSGTTMPGRTTSSSSGSTGRVSGVDVDAMISPQSVKLSRPD